MGQQPSSTPGASKAPPSVFEIAGGMPAFTRLADAFYARVEADPFLMPMFQSDLRQAREHLALFLAQYFGGPTEYSQRRGHPRLRMRHLPFRIGIAERDAWVGHMLGALDDVDIPEPARSLMKEYFERAATFLVNVATDLPTRTAP
jgi:hemoglobin